ncbi:COG4280 domain-containing protein [Actinomadura decatromicini]|nr:TMEM165/GDT1 family protein [Actinomadura decatromicini]
MRLVGRPPADRRALRRGGRAKGGGPMSAAVWGVVAASFAACFVEAVEAATIVMAMGFTRSWRSALLGTAAALGVLTVVTAVLGLGFGDWVPESGLQLVVGTLMLIFGLQWLRKAVLRSSGRKKIHDEEEIYREEVEAALAAGHGVGRIDMFSFMVSFKGVFLEGVEVVFIVITFGVNAHNVPGAAAGAGAALLVVLAVAAAIGRPLSMINENLLKYGVGLLLASFGTYWVGEGSGTFRAGGESLEWPGGDLAILGLLGVWFLTCYTLARLLRVPAAGGSVLAPGSTEGAR